MGRRRIRVADVKEILVHWDAGASISGIAQSLSYSRPARTTDENNHTLNVRALALAGPTRSQVQRASVFAAQLGKAKNESLGRNQSRSAAPHRHPRCLGLR